MRRSQIKFNYDTSICPYIIDWKMENIPHLTLQETRPPAKGLSHLKMLMQSYEIYYD